MKPLSPEKIEKVRREFEYFDEDGSGKLELEEFRKLFKVLAPESKRAEADAGFAAIDEDDSGEIDFDEFLEWWESNWFVF
ncbi:MAG: EF-hand domain-containing protein [Xanthomonadales bacterium]|nr:EF-hand domain-containing protein [Xanthomonadales bacterium]